MKRRMSVGIVDLCCRVVDGGGGGGGWYLDYDMGPTPSAVV